MQSSLLPQMSHLNYTGLSRKTIYFPSKCSECLGIILWFPFIAPAATPVSSSVFSHLFINRGSCRRAAIRSYSRMASAICASSPAPRRGDNNFPQSAGHTPSNVAQDVVCLFHDKSALLAHIQPCAHDNPRALPISTATRCSAPSLGLLHLGAALCHPPCCISGGQCSHLSHPSQTEAVSGVSHPRLAAPEALLKAHPVSVPLLLMASPVSAPGCFSRYWPPAGC